MARRNFRKELIRKITILDQKLTRTKRYPEWNNRIIQEFQKNNVYSFDELTYRDPKAVEYLIINYQD